MSLLESGFVKEITSKTWDKELSSVKVSVVDFWAPWCPPCRKMSQILEEISSEMSTKYGGKIGFFKVNVDKEQSLAQKFGIMTLPTIMGFSGTTPLDRFNGRTKEEFSKWVQKFAERLDVSQV